MKTKHHPDYDPEVEAGSVYLTREQAEALMLAVAAGLSEPRMGEAEKSRLLAAATAIEDVFNLGVRGPRPAKRKAARR